MLFLCLSALPLIACATVLSEPAPIEVRVCPPMAKYSAEEQVAASLELTILPSNSMLRQMMDDYGDLRARLRSVCAST